MGQVSLPKLKQARDLTLRARQLAIKAIEAAGIERRSRESIRGTIERAQERIGEIGQLVQESANPLAQQLLEQGQEQLHRARRAFQEADPRAVRLATLALELIERAGRVAMGAGPGIRVVETSIDRTEALLTEVEAGMAEGGNGGEAALRLDEAQRLLTRARAELRQGHARLALRLALEVRQAGLQLLSQLRREPSETELLPALEELEALYDELAVAAGARAAPQLRSLLTQAGEMLAKSRRSIEDGDAEEALALLVAAEALLREAAEAAGAE